MKLLTHIKGNTKSWAVSGITCDVNMKVINDVGKNISKNIAFIRWDVRTPIQHEMYNMNGY